MVERAACGGAGSGLELLTGAVERLLGEDPSALTPEAALARAGALLVARERLTAATLAAVRDVDVRELHCLEQAGSTRSWLRRQLGGDTGQLALARRLLERPVVAEAFAEGVIAQRAAGQLCAMLTDVPDAVDEPRLAGALDDGVRSLLACVTGRTGIDDERVPAATRAVRTEVEQVLAGCLTRTGASPADRLEPAVLLLARYLPAAQLGWALGVLSDALDPAEAPEPRGSRFYLELVPVLDGEWDLRGHLDPETGALLAAELDRQERAAQAAAAAATRAEAAQASSGEQLDLDAGIDRDDPGDGDGRDDRDDSGDDDGVDSADDDDDRNPAADDHHADGAAEATEAADAAFFAGLGGPRDEHQTSSSRRLLMRRARRHAAL